MSPENLIHVVWFSLSCAFGIWMYYRGAIKGTNTGVNAAIVFLVLNGKRREAEDFVKFVKSASTKDFPVL